MGAMSAEASFSTATARRDASRGVAAWLFVCCALVFAMVVVGGVTRLTHSGLSIVEWQPIVGTLPPLSEGQWQQTFEKYQLTPEYRQVNQGMTLAGFKGIFWWEYFHRLLGRLIGVVFLVPLLWFTARRDIPPGYAWKLFGIFVLGGLQGAMGWYMVQSGLVDDPRVSQFRLTAHLGLALAIFAAMFWVGLSLVHPRHATLTAAPQRSARTWAIGAAALVFVMALSGGFVAGIRAGFAYNTFPLMNGHLVPPEIFMIEPWWRNFFWNMATVQFDHRAIAWLLAVVVPVLWWKLRTTSGLPSRARWGGHLLVALVVAQIALGIATLLYVVPIPLAAAHQAGAVLVFAAALNVAHALR
jgi:cytochrome c oxidase assembly protein subunit 15